MNLVIGLLIIGLGAFCQSSSYVPINKIKSWSWESYWIVQGVFAWLLFPLCGALLSLSGTGGSFGDLMALMQADPKATWLTILFGVLWGIGGLTFGLSLGKGFLTDYPVLITFSWCILMSLNVVFSNVWGIILKEWKGVSRKTIAVLVAGIIVLIISTFLPQFI